MQFSIPTPFVDNTGFVIPTYTEIFNSLVATEQSIFGTDTNYDTNSPDGQRLAITAQICTDSYESQQNLFNSYFLDFALGNSLDMVVGRKGITRKAGTFSTILISVTTTSLCTLQGLDANINNVNGTGYTVQDNLGNQWILAATTTIPVNTTISLLFRAQNYGASTASPNTITISSTIVVGVSSVTNPSDVLTTGTNEETDTALRVRGFASFAFASQNQVDAVYSQLFNLTGVTDVITMQNNTATPDVWGTNPFTLWTIVENGDDMAIAKDIYTNIHGSGMRGAVSETFTSINGISTITVNFDRPLYTTLYVRFDIQTTVTGTTFDTAAIKAYIVANIKYTLWKPADSGTLTCIALAGINSLGGGGVPISLEISTDNTNWFSYIATTSPQYKFMLSAANITITVLP